MVTSNHPQKMLVFTADKLSYIRFQPSKVTAGDVARDPLPRSDVDDSKILAPEVREKESQMCQINTFEMSCAKQFKKLWKNIFRVMHLLYFKCLLCSVWLYLTCFDHNKVRCGKHFHEDFQVSLCLFMRPWAMIHAIISLEWFSSNSVISEGLLCHPCAGQRWECFSADAQVFMCLGLASAGDVCLGSKFMVKFAHAQPFIYIYIFIVCLCCIMFLTHQSKHPLFS